MQVVHVLLSEALLIIAIFLMSIVVSFVEYISFGLDVCYFWLSLDGDDAFCMIFSNGACFEVSVRYRLSYMWILLCGDWVVAEVAQLQTCVRGLKCILLRYL